MIEHALYLQDTGSRQATAAAEQISADAIRAQLRKMSGCKLFAHCPRLRRFLEFTVEEALAGNQGRLKEYFIGVEVFGKPDSFDPRLDSIVRVEARRLRAKVIKYYETLGKEDDFAILYRRGDYVPYFLRRPWPTSGPSIGHSWTADGNSRPQIVVVAPHEEQARRLAFDLARLGYDVAASAQTTAHAEQFVAARGLTNAALVEVRGTAAATEPAAAEIDHQRV